jgi:hypothetical protein
MKHGAFVGQMVFAHGQADKAAKHLRVVQCLIHCWVRQAEPILEKMDAQHSFHSKLWSATGRVERRCVGNNKRNELGPRLKQIHLVQELAHASSIGPALESRCDVVQAHLFFCGFNDEQPAPSGG